MKARAMAMKPTGTREAGTIRTLTAEELAAVAGGEAEAAEKPRKKVNSA
jgi:hypothetical protein